MTALRQEILPSWVCFSFEARVGSVAGLEASAMIFTCKFLDILRYIG